MEVVAGSGQDDLVSPDSDTVLTLEDDVTISSLLETILEVGQPGGARNGRQRQ